MLHTHLSLSTAFVTSLKGSVTALFGEGVGPLGVVVTKEEPIPPKTEPTPLAKGPNHEITNPPMPAT